VLFVLGVSVECKDAGMKEEVENLLQTFFGSVLTDSANAPSMANKTVYLCGDLAKASAITLENASQVSIIKELSFNYDDSWPFTSLGRVPISVHGVGVLYRQFFDPQRDYFNRVRAEHAFQALTESNKKGRALRTGIYLTPVEKNQGGGGRGGGGDALYFNLLRCSSNLSGPTSNFGSNDRQIVAELNAEARALFENPAPLNHVLAQIYYNTAKSGPRKQAKAKISSHADKTKDMPRNALMAFCTFYTGLDRLRPVGRFDYAHQNSARRRGGGSKLSANPSDHETGLTSLVFRLKHGLAEKYPKLTRQFSVRLYPNSVFFMPITTNRIYTHEIRPSALPASYLPTRLGYVVRCSSTRAVHKEGQTFVLTKDKALALREPSPEDVKKLKELYRAENLTDAIIDYKPPILFSMNRGDYTRPQHILPDEFRWFALSEESTAKQGRGEEKSRGGGRNLYGDLVKSVHWEEAGKGRLATVLVKPKLEKRYGGGNQKGGGAKPAMTPIVRTTAKFSRPANCFRAVHDELASRIKREGGLVVEFNNALIETYTNVYRKMAFHSDMALDLDEGTTIALYSCYEHPGLGPPRVLVVQAKKREDGKEKAEKNDSNNNEPETFEIPLVHNSVVTFSVDTNRRFRHKIVLPKGDHLDNQWLGVTFRTSKTFVHYPGEGGERSGREGKVLFESGKELSLLSNEKRSEFFKMRGRENREVDFKYPNGLCTTISASDLMPPVEAPESSESSSSFTANKENRQRRQGSADEHHC